MSCLRRVRVIALPWLFMLAAVPAIAQQGIAGRVADSVTDTPLSAQLLVFDAFGTPVGSFFTAADGSYIAPLPAGTFLVVASAPGYGGELYDDVPCTEGACATEQGTPVVVATDAVTSGIDFLLDAVTTVSGTVVAVADGTPLQGVQVLLVEDGTTVRASALTQANGSYVIDAPIGTFTVYTSNGIGFVDQLHPGLPCPYRVCDDAAGTPVVTMEGSQEAGIDFELTVGGGISGFAQDVTAEPVDATVSIFTSSGLRLTTVLTSAGEWAVDRLPPGDYHVRFDAIGFDSQLFDQVSCTAVSCEPTSGTPVSVAPPAITAGVDATLTGAGPPPPAMLAYLHRCPETGCTLSGGPENAIFDRSSLVSGTRVLRPWTGTDEEFDAVEQCVRASFARYRLQITTEDPGAVPHREHMLGGLPGDIGQPSTVAGVSPFACGAGIQNSISFTFGNVLGNDVAEVCSTIAHEIAHQFGLEHELQADDHMSYLLSAQKSFTDVDAGCGESSPQACLCGGSVQNSHQRLLGLIGQQPLVFADSFEADTSAAASKQAVTPQGSGAACGTFLGLR